MSVRAEEPLQRLRMSWEEFLALPARPKAEWVDGEVVMTMAPVTPDHGGAVVRLGALLLALFPSQEVLTEVGLQLPRNRLRGPDLMVVDGPVVGRWVTEPPLLCVEVVSPSTRSEDTVRKSMEYAEGGVGQYWVVDPELRSIDAWRNVDGQWELIARLDDDHPSAEIDLAGVPVPLDLSQILRRPPATHA